MTTRPLLVGEASNLPGGEVLRGASGRRLADLAGEDLDRFHELFECVNLLARWPGRSGGVKGHVFDPAAARRAAARLDLRGRTVVLLGKRVARAFGLADPPWLQPLRLGRGEAAAFVVPHPSGIVRWYNEAGNRRAVGRLLRCILKRARSRKC